MDEPGFDSRQVTILFSSTQVRTESDTPSSLLSRYREQFHGTKQPCREADYLVLILKLLEAPFSHMPSWLDA
jgi:hypothetical protein